VNTNFLSLLVRLDGRIEPKSLDCKANILITELTRQLLNEIRSKRNVKPQFSLESNFTNFFY